MGLAAILALLSWADVAAPEREAAVLEACTGWMSQRGADAPAVHRVDEDGLCFAGRITDESAAAFVGAVSTAAPEHPLVVVVRSAGGEVEAAMAMAEALVPRNTTVAVHYECASSCANYLFLAGDRRVIGPRATLAYHGGVVLSPESRWEALRDEWARTMSAGDLAASLQASREYEIRNHSRQAAFLATVGVDEGLFDWMQGLNDLSPEQRLEKCPVPTARLIVFSDKILAEHGIVVHRNDGPRSDEELAAELGRSAGIACYWD